MTAFTQSDRMDMELIRNMAYAVRAGFADKEGWDDFLKSIRANETR